MATKNIAALADAQNIGWSDALISRLGAGSISTPRITITPPSNASALAVSGYSLTGSNAQSLLDLSGTWNTSGTPTLISATVTDTASNASSLLVRFTVGSSDVFRVFKSGTIFANAFTCNADSTVLSASSLRLNTDTFILRDAANTLALRNGTNAQAFNIYNTYSSASVYERGFARWAANVFEIGTEHLGASARDTWVNSANHLTLRVGGTSNVVTVRFGGSNRYQLSNTAFYPDLAGVNLGTTSKPWKDIFLNPSASLTPSANGDLCVEATNDTTLTLKYKGSDGTVRSVALTLAP